VSRVLGPTLDTQYQVISETSLSRQSLALVLTTQNKQEKIRVPKTHEINKLTGPR